MPRHVPVSSFPTPPLLPLLPCLPHCSRKYHVPEVDVEAAEAVLAETSMEPVLEEGSDSEAEQAGKHHRRGSARLPGSSTRSTVGSEAPLPSGGSTPACSSAASSGCSSPRSGVDAAAAPLAPAPAGPEGVAATAAARPTAASLTAAGPGRPCAPGAAAAGHAHSSSAGGFGSPGSSASRRSSLEREGRPSMRAVAANWRAWLAVRDAPCPGHPWRYSEEQVGAAVGGGRVLAGGACREIELVLATVLHPEQQRQACLPWLQGLPRTLPLPPSRCNLSPADNLSLHPRPLHPPQGPAAPQPGAGPRHATAAERQRPARPRAGLLPRRHHACPQEVRRRRGSGGCGGGGCCC